MKKYSIKKVEKNLNIGLATLAVIMFCIDSAVFGSFINKTVKAEEVDADTLKSIEYSINYDVNEVVIRLNNALDKNEYLTCDEKDLIRSNLWVFIDNKDYMDLNYIEKTLLTIKIKYNKKIKYKDKVITKAEYSDKRNEIIFYNSSNLYDVDYSIFTHELFHSMQKKKDFDKNIYLIETVNTIFNEEYAFGKDDNVYCKYYYFTKMLMEIIGEEPFRRYQCYASIDFITSELSNIYGTEDDARLLLELLDKYQELYVKTINGNERAVSKALKLKEEIINRIGLYYEAKYGFSMENDLIMLYYYDKNEFYKKLNSRFSNNKDGIILYEYNDIDYFHGSDSHTLIINERGPINLKKIYIGKTEIKEKEETINDYEIIYQIDESNRYLNNVMSLKKH